MGNKPHWICISAIGIPHQFQAANLPCLKASLRLNSFVLPILGVERQHCSITGSGALTVKLVLTAPALIFFMVSLVTSSDLIHVPMRPRHWSI